MILLTETEISEIKKLKVKKKEKNIYKNSLRQVWMRRDESKKLRDFKTFKMKRWERERERERERSERGR